MCELVAAKWLLTSYQIQGLNYFLQSCPDAPEKLPLLWQQSIFGAVQSIWPSWLLERLQSVSTLSFPRAWTAWRTLLLVSHVQKDYMIKQAGKMIKGLVRNLKRMCAPSKSRKKVDQQLVKEDDSGDSSQSSSSSRKTISEDRESLLSSTSQTVQEIIKEEVSHYTGSTYDSLKSLCSHSNTPACASISSLMLKLKSDIKT